MAGRRSRPTDLFMLRQQIEINAERNFELPTLEYNETE